MKKVLAIAAVLIVGSHRTIMAKENSKEIKVLSKPIKIVSSQSAKSDEGTAEYFTGKVRVTTVTTPEDSNSMSCASVAFEPGARSAWHTHPKGQILVVTEGAGLIQETNGPVRRIKTGDIIWTPANVKHWHGASPNTALVHTAIQEIVNGTPVTWMEKVTDEQYKVSPQ
jgi:quercetin dioxygenase-like cupin family protein